MFCFSNRFSQPQKQDNYIEVAYVSKIKVKSNMIYRNVSIPVEINFGNKVKPLIESSRSLTTIESAQSWVFV